MMQHVMSRVMAGAGLVLVLAGAAWADRTGVETTLRQMGERAAAADVEGYLSWVDRKDSLFFKEQENWAKDLKRKTPVAVAFTIVEPQDGEHKSGASTPQFGADKARFEMLTTWTMPGEKEGEKRAERSVSFPVVFVAGEGGKWLYAGEDWLTLESDGAATNTTKDDAAHHNEAAGPKADGKGEPEEKKETSRADEIDERPRDTRFQGPIGMPGPAGAKAKPHEHRARVKYFAGYEAVARRIVEVLPQVRDHVDEGFCGEVPRVQEVKLYPNMRHLQESIYLSYADPLGGWNEPGEAIKLVTRPNSGKRGLRVLLAHEYGHVATFELGPKANDMPWWVLEGVAELSAERFASVGRDAENLVIRWSDKNALAKWDDLADFHKVLEDSPPDLQTKVYKQGHHMLMYISDRWGRDVRNQWLSGMARGLTIDEATRAATGMAWEDLDGAWRGRVKELSAEAAAKKAQDEAAKESDKGKSEKQ